MRAAVYWAPAPADPFWQAGSIWLGRDAETGAACEQPNLPGIAELTADPRRYGFHATLRAPIRLAGAWHDFVACVQHTAAAARPFVLPPLEIADIGGFLALRETARCPPLHALCDSIVVATNPFRVPPDDAERARRQAPGLSARQQAYLDAYGYPYVLDDYFFHVTLTRRLSAAEKPAVEAAAHRHFAPFLGASRLIEEIAIFTQAEARDFLIADRVQLGR